VARIAGAPGDEQMAYDFIDAWLSPETGKFLIEEYGYGHSNKKSFEIADPEKVAALGYADPEDLINNTIFFTSLTPEQDEKQLGLWEEILAGM
jgi:spermidine/putrescine-binding protein